jgi:ATP-dependent Clp protease adaptor protein ClpS
MTAVIEKPRVGGSDIDHDDGWKVIVLDDNHNTFDSVAWACATYIPGVSFERGYEIADEVHTKGLSIVWRGQKEIAELYHQQLADAGLTMADLER